MSRQTSTLSTEQSSHSTVPIVAIGASAGGLETISELIASLSPTTGMAYVYIQHADGPTLGGPTLGGPTLSDLTESNPLVVLGRVTTMPVVAVGNQMPIRPNHVYVIAPGTGNPAQPEYGLDVIDGVLTFAPGRSGPPGV